MWGFFDAVSKREVCRLAKRGRKRLNSIEEGGELDCHSLVWCGRNRREGGKAQ